MPFPPRDHHISLAAAQALTKRFREQGAAEAGRAGAFHGEQVQALLAQEGCVALRVWFGLNEDGTSAVILIGVDSDNKDLIEGEILEFTFPCPPFCDSGGL